MFAQVDCLLLRDGATCLPPHHPPCGKQRHLHSRSFDFILSYVTMPRDRRKNQVFILRFLEMEKSRHSLCRDREASIVVESCDFSFLSFDRIYILTTIHYSNGQRPTLCCSQIEMVPSKHVHQNKNQIWPKTK